jgi:cytochrome b561
VQENNKKIFVFHHISDMICLLKFCFKDKHIMSPETKQTANHPPQQAALQSAMSSKYPFSWRILHWLMAAMIVGLIIVGIVMADRAEANIWDDLTNILYAWHKALGFSIIFLIILRIVIRRREGVPTYPTNVSPKLLFIAHQAHTLLYTLMIIVPLMGWAAVTAYPALITIGGYHLPAMPFVPQSETLAKQLFDLHGWLAITLGIIIIAHIAGGLKHLFIERDGVFQRMWFGSK